MKIFFTAALFVFLLCPLPAQQTSQNEEESPETVSDEANRKRRWQANIRGGRYIVRLDAITSISQSSYVLDGNLIVTEVAIDTTGNSLARFYHIEPVTESASGTLGTVTKRARELGRRAAKLTTAEKIARMAQKNYPATTHAHTIEFRLDSKAELNALFTSASTAWDSGKGRSLEVKDEEQ